jgi:hypothetical protein
LHKASNVRLSVVHTEQYILQMKALSNIQSWGIMQFLFNLEVTLQRRQGLNADTPVCRRARRAQKTVISFKSLGALLYLSAP